MQQLPQLPRLYDPAYGGWFANLFSKEGRAENKRVRAKKAKAKGKTKKVSRLSRRASVLETKAAGTVMLTDKSSATKLWAVKEPWASRKSHVGKGMAATAAGFRPNLSHTKAEERAVIIGGITTLSTAGISPWTDYDLSMETVDPSNKRAGGDNALVHKVATAASSAGYSGIINSLRTAAEYVRKIVIANGLSTTAWRARKGLLLDASTSGSQKKAIGLSGAASTLGIASGVVAATGVGVPVAIVLGVAAAGFAGAAAITQSRGTKAAADAVTEAAAAMTAATQTRSESETAVAEAQATLAAKEAQAAEMEAAAAKAKMLRMVGWAGVGVSGIVLLTIILRSRRR